ncbi:starch synthase 3, chloroplastic/amyloplastic isoform X2 [Diospyros lotus]|uniref:starch synthase 3, chloroplastic/amyloplastic isoform X2 n=1 Tax=Diospyros lotus TaxID=55363 RepID=UPI0022517F1C|nr:starch synthase 3, chloroplastic/amyloplastic isoform X2 [Diospyros lotus]
MEVPLQTQRPLCCSTLATDKTQFRIKPFLGFFPHWRTTQSSQSSSWQKDFRVPGISHKITSSADFSRRRNRKMSSPRPKDSTPKGFMPKTQLGTSSQKRDQRSNREKEGQATPKSNEYAASDSKTPKLRVSTDKEQLAGVHQANKIEEQSGDNMDENEDKVPSTMKQTDINVQQEAENGRIGTINEDVNPIVENVEDGEDTAGLGGTVPLDSSQSEVVKENESHDIDDLEKTMATSVGDALNGIYVEGQNLDGRKCEDTRENESLEIVKDNTRSQFVIGEPVKEANVLVTKEKEDEDSSLKLKLEIEAFQKQVVERLAEEKISKGIKMFSYPEVVKPDQDIDVFLNRSLSTLNNEPDVMIMGAFNDWRWRSFTAKLNKSHLKRDLWSCKVHIPKEAYKMDFVFFNGKDIYDNNDGKDFCITVEGGMDVFEFEDFLLEEKHRELEKLAKEQAERERREEEQRQIEAEKAAMEADRAQAREEVKRKRETLQGSMKKAARFIDNVWYIEPSVFKGEDKIKLYYNKGAGPLLHAKELWIHGGHNNWKDGLSIVACLASSDRKDGDWWYADVIVPDCALLLDWVFADGPPQNATIYDNNHRQDFHAIVPKGIPEELYWVEEEHQIYKKLQEERRLKEEAMRAKAERTASMKAEMKERTLKMFLLSQKHIVYTEPLDVRAGSTITVFYNPANTVLNGKSEIWFRCSFNRWTHRMGLLPPQKMSPAESGSHVKATVKVPLDAYMMDFVFSEREDGGVFDNKNGMDYHIPVFGGVVKEPPMNIVHISVEMAPIAKVGGLGDVVTSLSRAVQDLNHNVDIILPKYDCLNLSNVRDFQFLKSFSWGGTEIKVWTGNVEGLPVYFLEPQNRFFWTGCIYGCRNDAERFGFFCHAALEFLLQSGFHPDIIHCHDWSSAPVAWLFKDHYMHYGLSKARVVFTIHNLEFGASFISKAMAYSDKATTVSNTYSKEVSGNPAIAPHLYKFHGILNGIDPDLWDPYNDKFIPISYTAENVVEGKRAAKQALQQKLGLKRDDLPLVGVITRLTHQKGIHLIKHAIRRTLERNGQVVLLGSAPDPRIQNDFVDLANQLHSSHADRARLCLTYDEPLSHLIYAGADFILVPSIFEPCGLTQLIAMRYGSIPVVRKTGGLYDTVFDVDHDKERAESQGLQPNGFSFDVADAAGVDYALNRAISAWYDGRDWFNTLCKRVMEQDWSWNRPALDYLELYHAACK